MPTGLGDEQLWWCPSLDDSANDISGYGRNGTYNNGIATVADTDATYGGSRAYFSNAANQRVSLTNFGESLTETTTISLWTKSTNPWVCVPIVSGGFGYSASSWAWAVFNSTTTRILWRRSSNLNFPTATPNNQWQHICIVRETGSSTQEVYVDGTLVVTSASSNGASGVGGFWSGFGNGTGTGEELFVDDIRTYGRALTQTEITHLATSRGIEGSPSGATHYNPFKTHAFTNNFQQRLR